MSATALVKDGVCRQEAKGAKNESEDGLTAENAERAEKDAKLDAEKDGIMNKDRKKRPKNPLSRYPTRDASSYLPNVSRPLASPILRVLLCALCVLCG